MTDDATTIIQRAAQPVGDDEARIEFVLNEGWQGSGPKPYTMLEIGECILATRLTERGARHPDADADAEEYRAKVLARARLRWKAGYYADPFTQNPRKRPKRHV